MTTTAHASTAPRETSTAYGAPHRPGLLRWANGLGRQAWRITGPSPSLRPEGLIRRAEAQTGLTVEGLVEDAPPFQDRLARLVAAIEAETHPHPVGRLMVRENLVRILAGRLRFEALCRAHPEAQSTRLAPPLVIVGLQRTGTTLLHRLLAQDPANRWLASWEAVQPVPLPAPRSLGSRALDRLARQVAARALRRRDGGRPDAILRGGWPALDPRDPRVRQALLAESTLRAIAPDFFAVHPVEAEAPEEDCLLFDYALAGTVPEATLGVRSFGAWLETQDRVGAYRFLSRMLRALAWLRPAVSPRPGGVRWVLKTPQHLEDLDALLAVFPDARVVQTHRDPAVALVSFCSMMAHGRAVFSDRVVPAEIAAQWRRKTRRMVSRSLAVRDRMGVWRERQTFLDIQYADLLANPLGAVRRIYAWMGRTLRPEARAAMEAYLRANPQHKHGRHRYRAADFELDPAAVRADLTAYRARFRVPSEDVP